MQNRFGLLLAGAIGSATNTVFVLTGIFIFLSRLRNVSYIVSNKNRYGDNYEIM